MRFIDPAIEAYALKHSDAESDVLYKLYRETHLKTTMPQMISGHLQGLVLRMFSHMIRPEKILEIGTFTGYSSICMAQGLNEGGQLFTIEVNEEFRNIIETSIRKAGLESKITLLLGDAVNILEGLNEVFDMVFIDADKERYPLYYDLVFPKVKKGGFIIADNVLWSGKILDSAMKMDTETRAISDFNHKISSDSRVEKVLLPLRDGLMIARKK